MGKLFWESKQVETLSLDYTYLRIFEVIPQEQCTEIIDYWGVEKEDRH